MFVLNNTSISLCCVVGVEASKVIRQLRYYSMSQNWTRLHCNYYSLARQTGQDRKLQIAGRKSRHV